MKFPTRYLVAAALVAAPVHAAAQTTPPPAAQGEHAREGRRADRDQPRSQQGPGGGSPVQRLVAQRERLSLTDAQVQRLQAIDRDLQARSAPLQQQLAGIFPERGEQSERPQGERRGRGERPQPTEAQRQQMQQRREQAQPIMEQLRQNREAALTQAHAVLTAEQQAQVQRREGRRDGRRGEQGEGRRGERREDRRGEGREDRREGRRGERPAAGADRPR